MLYNASKTANLTRIGIIWMRRLNKNPTWIFSLSLGLFVLSIGTIDAQETASEGASPESLPSPADFSRAHLPSDQIADLFRAQNSVQAVDESPERIGSNDNIGTGETGSDKAPTTQTDLDELRTKIESWIDQLGSNEFAIREQATASLREAGKPTLPALNRIASEHPDPEVRTRAGDITQGITGGETAGQLDAFLLGKNVPIDGWNIAQKILGDGVRIRELYVDLLMRHGDVAVSLDATTKQRYAAFRSTVVGIQRGMFVEGRLPTEADLIALMLLANDHEMTINRVEEEAVFSVLRRDATNKLLTDAQWSGPFRALLGGWVSRENIINQQEMLWFSLTWDLAETRELATTFLKKTTDPVTIAMSLQAIARFGDQEDIDLITKYLDDERPASEQRYSAGALIQAQVRDAAAAAIVVLSDRALAEFDMNARAVHPKYGIIIQELGFPTDDPEPRKQAIKKVRKELIAKSADAE